MSQVYCRLLSNEGHGHPLWIPEPNENLSYEYRQRGVSIGDVGMITANGGFDFLFNICLPATDPINRGGVPEGFVPVMLDAKDVAKEWSRFPPGATIRSSVARNHAEDFLGNDGYLAGDMDPDKVPIGQFFSESGGGALLILPEGASREDLVNTDILTVHANLNAAAYYQIANGLRGRRADNNSLFLVTGCDKTKSWKLASLSDPSNTYISGGADNMAYRVQSECSESVQTRFGPIPLSDTENQCVFLRGLTISSPQKRDNKGVDMSKPTCKGICTPMVITLANSSKAKVVKSVAAQKARLQNASEAIEEAGEGEGTSAQASPPQAGPVLTKALSAVATPQAKKVDSVKRAATLPAGALPKVDAGPLNLVDEVSQEESSKTRAPAPHASNIADAQFDSLREEVPMPPSLMHFMQEHWDTLCHNNNIFKGIRLDDNGPNPSIADLIQPLNINDIHYALNDMARTETTTTYTERNFKYANNGWTTKALSVTSPWVDASVNAEQEERRASSKDVKTIYTSVFQKYPFVTIGIKQRSLRPSAEFQDAVVAALKQPQHKRKDALDKVFGTCGHVVQMEFDVGALMVKTSTAMTSNEMSQEKFEETVGFVIKTLISHIPVKLGTTAEKGKKVDDYKVEHDTDKQQVYELRGGNARWSLGAWVQTITDYTTWRVIKTSDVIPVVEILPAELQREIEALTPHAEKPSKPLSGIWVDAIEHVSNPKDEIEANWFKLHRAETGNTGDWFWLGYSLDRNKVLIVKENEPGALGLLAKPNKIWDNDGADTRERQTIWDFSPANPEKYVSLGSYFQCTHGKKPEPPPSFKDEYLKSLRAVRRDLLVQATLGENTYWHNDTGGTATHKGCIREVVQAPEKTGKDDAPATLETHLFKGFNGVAAQRADHCERTVFLIKKSAIEIIDGDYDPPAHQNAFVGETRVREAGFFRNLGRSFYKVIKDFFR